jgi:hypothetical protein
MTNNEVSDESTDVPLIDATPDEAFDLGRVTGYDEGQIDARKELAALAARPAPAATVESNAREALLKLFQDVSNRSITAENIAKPVDDLLADAILEWMEAAGYRLSPPPTGERLFTRGEVEQMVSDNTDNQGNLYRIDFLSTLEHEAELELPSDDAATKALDFAPWEYQYPHRTGGKG